jgi:hypothetical protein
LPTDLILIAMLTSLACLQCRLVGLLALLFHWLSARTYAVGFALAYEDIRWHKPGGRLVDRDVVSRIANIFHDYRVEQREAACLHYKFGQFDQGSVFLG